MEMHILLLSLGCLGIKCYHCDKINSYERDQSCPGELLQDQENTRACRLMVLSDGTIVQQVSTIRNILYELLLFRQDLQWTFVNPVTWRLFNIKSAKSLEMGKERSYAVILMVAIKILTLLGKV